jgi:GTP-binding protein EngB required for normal cell division
MAARPHSEEDARHPRWLDHVAAALDRASAAVEACMLANAAFVRRLAELRRRLAEQRLHLAVLGQFKRGKSTFINALLGEALLPTGVIPLTSVPTFITWDERPLVRVDYASGRDPDEFHASEVGAIHDLLFRFVAEEANPENRLGVDRVTLFYPAPVLAGGIVLVDTPGIGSSHKHNTDAALRILPECDAAIIVTSVDPPITEVELQYIGRLRPHVGRLFVVMNKIDHLAPDERLESVDFLRKILEREAILAPGGTIFCLSARQGLSAKRSQDPAAYDASGMAAVEILLLHELAQEKMRLLGVAVTRKAQDVLAEVAADIALRVRALEMPLDELGARSADFKRALTQIAERRLTVGDLLAGERRRLVGSLETRIEDLRGSAATALNAVASRTFDDNLPGAWEAALRASLPLAIDDLFESALAEIAEAITAQAGGVLASHRERVNALVDAVRRASAEAFAFPFAPSSADEPFHHGKAPYWVTQDWGSGLAAGAEKVIDRLLPKTLRRLRAIARIERQIEETVLRNAENLRWTMLRGIDETFNGATAELETRLDEAIAATETVIDAAMNERSRQSASLDPEIAQLRRRSELVAAARDALAREADGRSSPDQSFTPSVTKATLTGS